MGLEDQARRDVESTLEAGRASLERGIARGRLALFGGMTVFGAVLSTALFFTALGSRVDSSLARAAPLLVFGMGALYAAVVWRLLARSGKSRANIEWVAFTDPFVFAVCAVTLRHVMVDPASGPSDPLPARFDIYGLAPFLIVLTFLSCVRVSRRRVLPVAVFTIAVYLTAIRLDVGRFEPPQFFASLIIGVSAGMGAASARRVSMLLERQSRLALLGSYLPRAFAERLGSEAVDLQEALQPHALEVTIVVTDLRGFTAMSEKMAPAAVVQMLSEFHAAMLEAVDAHSGVVDKFLGDGMLLVFGLPSMSGVAPTDAGALAAVECSSALIQRLDTLNLSRAREGQAPLAMGIGIHTGAVIAGTIGAGRRREFTVIGDAVNTASRLEGLTKTAGTPVLVTAETVSRLGAAAARLSLQELAPMPVRGKTEPLRVFALAKPSTPAG